jgi:transcriptional regulator GlxA family with amidase domain
VVFCGSKNMYFRMGQAEGVVGGEGVVDHATLREAVEKGAAALWRKVPSGECHRANLQAAHDFIKLHIAREITIEELSAAAFLSPFHFCREFRRATRMSPHKYINAMRMETARILLRDGTRSVVGVAAMVGVHSRQSFRRMFSDYWHENPSDITRPAPR